MKQKNVILMVVAVGCGLVAAFLTAQMSGKTVEQVDVVVAAKDLVVGTVFTKEELKNQLKTKKVAKDLVTPGSFVTDPEELVDKRLSRPMRTDETINPADLNKGVTLPDGHDLVALSVGASNAASGFIVPGCKVDVQATLRLGTTTKVFDLLVNTLVVNVNHDMTNNKTGVYPDINQVGFALTRRQAAALGLAKSRGCVLELKLRNEKRSAEDDVKYNLEEVIKLLEDEKNPSVVKTNEENKQKEPAPAPPVAPPTTTDVAPLPVIKTVKVLVATRFIEANTTLTADLIAADFTTKELPKDFAPNAMEDLTPAVGKALRSGLGVGQWVTPDLVGLPISKAPPQESFIPAKPGPGEPKPEVRPEPKPEPAKKKYVDVAVHTATGTIIWRYEDNAGKLKKVAELTPEQANETSKPDAPKAAPDVRKD